MKGEAGERLTVAELARRADFRLGAVLVSPSVRIIKGPDCEASLEPLAMQVLMTLADADGAVVTREDIFRCCWGDAIVGDDSLNRVIADIRRALRTVAAGSLRIETVPRTGYRLADDSKVGMTAGSIVSRLAGGPVLTARTTGSRTGAMALMLLISLFVVLAGAWGLLGRHGIFGWNGRVAIAAFEMRQTDPALSALAAAAPEALVRALSANGISASSANPPGWGPELRVVGSVYRDDDRVVMTVQVHDRGRRVLWSDRFQETAARPSIFVETVAGRVGEVLECALEGRAGGPRRIDTAAFRAYLNVCAAWGDGRPGLMLAHARRLTEIAPNLANAHAMRGIAAGLAAQATDHSPVTTAALLSESRDAAQRALSLNPGAANGYLARELSLGPKGDFIARERDLQMALEREPDGRVARGRYAVLLRDVGRVRAAVELAAREPRTTGVGTSVAVWLAATGDRGGAERELRRLLASDARGYAAARYTIAFWWDDRATALEVIRALGPQASSPPGRACTARFRSELSKRQASNTRGLPPECDTMMADWRARMLSWQGDVDGAYAILEQPSRNSRGQTHFLFYPEMRAVRADPRFMPLAARLGLVNYWLRSGNWPDFCADADAPYDCRKAARVVSVQRQPVLIFGAISRRGPDLNR